jgi:hypothetical protein
MGDILFEKLKESVKRKVGLNNDVGVKVTDEELAILTKKAEDVDMEVGELLREYILTTAVFGEKTSVKKSKPKTVRAKGGNE